MNLKKRISAIVICAYLIVGAPPSLHAFDFGATALAIFQLVRQHVIELAKLEKIIRQGKDAYRLANDVHRGIQDTIRILKSLEDTLEPGTFRRLQLNLNRIIRKVERVYGKIPNTPRKEALMLHDQTVVDTIKRHNQIYEDHKIMKNERKWIESELKRRPSPSRAAQLSATLEYEILKALARIEKNQAASLKLLALNLGAKNEIEKKRSEQTLEQYQSLSDAFSATEFNTPLPLVN